MDASEMIERMLELAEQIKAKCRTSCTAEANELVQLGTTLREMVKEDDGS